MHNVPYIVGFVIGVAPLCATVLSPLIGYLVSVMTITNLVISVIIRTILYFALQLPHLGVKFTQLAGLFLAAGSLILFG